MIRVALQAKGRLNEDSLEIFKEAGIKIEASKRKLLSHADNFPLEVLYLRDDDIPAAVAAGVADIGIVGENEVAEKGATVDCLHKLGFGKCRISLAIPKADEYESLDYFNNKRIATSYPNILKKFFAENNITAEIEEIAGSVEIAPAVNIADAIFDIVSSGGTLVSNGLKEVVKAFYSEAVLVANPNLTPEKKEIVDQLIFRFESIERSRGKKYILLNVENSKIDEVLEILPSMKSPTLLPLANKDWSSIHAVVNEDLLWEMIGKLKEMGAEDILVLSLEKMIP
ncbi:MAG: ATP phosphoribosyltransferase [Rikenellaceae bacterium]